MTPAHGWAAQGAAMASAAHSSEAGACWRTNTRSSLRDADCACAAVVHSSSWRRLTAMRQTERSAASSSMQRLRRQAG